MLLLRYRELSYIQAKKKKNEEEETNELKETVFQH